MPAAVTNLAHHLRWKGANFDLVKTGNLLVSGARHDHPSCGSVKGGERGGFWSRETAIVMDDHAQAMPVVPQDVCINAHRDACPSRPRKGRGLRAVRERSDCSRCCFGSRTMFLYLQ